MWRRMQFNSKGGNVKQKTPAEGEECGERVLTASDSLRQQLVEELDKEAAKSTQEAYQDTAGEATETLYQASIRQRRRKARGTGSQIGTSAAEVLHGLGVKKLRHKVRYTSVCNVVLGMVQPYHGG
jgi:hypothetical protein